MLKKAVSKAAGELKPEAYPLGYVEDFDEPRTSLGAIFNILPILLSRFLPGSVADPHPHLSTQRYDKPRVGEES